MLPDNASKISKKTPDLLDSLNSSVFENKIAKDAKFEYNNILISFNSNTPQLTQFQNNSISEIQQKHILITRVSVPPQFVYSILNQLIDLSKSLKYKFLNEKLFSAYALPNDPSSIFFEGPTKNEILQLFSIFQNSFLITENDIMQFTDTPDIIQNVCNPLRTISFQVGTLIRISTPSFQNQLVQVLDFLSEKSQIIIKFCPKIDYDLLLQKGFKSQIQLNDSMPPEYLAPLDTFQPEKLKSSIPSVEITNKEIKLTWVDQPIICDFWDGYYFLGPLQCKKIDISHLILEPFNLISGEIELFQEGLTQFEKENEAFIRNFQMSYDASYETTVPDLNLLDLNCESVLNKLSEDTQNSISNSNDINQNLKESNSKSLISSSFSYTESNQNHQESNKENPSSDGSHIRPYQSVESLPKDHNKLARHHHPTIDKKHPQNFKVGDYVMSTIPLEKIFLKIREINNQGLIKADFLNLPCLGNSTQFVKVSSRALCTTVQSVYELGPQDFPQGTKDIDIQTEKDLSNLYRVGDIVQLSNNDIGVILDTNDESQEIEFLNLNNESHHYKFADVEDTLLNYSECKDYNGNKLFLHNKVFFQKERTGEIMAMHEDHVLVMDDKDSTFQFYKSTKLLLNTKDILVNIDQTKNSNNYDNGYNSNKNNNYGNNFNNYNDDFPSQRSNNNNNYGNDYKGSRNNYDSGYNNKDNYDNDYNKGRISGHNSNYRYDDYNGYDNRNNSNWHSKDSGNRSMPSHLSPPRQSKHTPPPPPPPSKLSPKPNDKPFWAQKNFMVIVPDDKRDAVINDIKDDIAIIQFVNNETKALAFGNKQYSFKVLKPMSFNVGDNVVSYDEGRKPTYGKVSKMTNNHVYLQEEKKKSKDRYRPYNPCFLIKNTYRYYNWDSLED